MTNIAQELRDIAVTVARSAGDMALAGRKQGDVAASTKSSPTDLVTEYDKASEQLIINSLQSLRPQDGLVGEEGANKPSESGITWHIDPIDGTTNFFFDVPAWAVSVGASDEHGPIAGAVYIPALGEMFSGARDGGATLNDAPIHVRKNSRLQDALVGTGFAYDPQKRIAHAQVLAHIMGNIRDIRRFGAAAIDLCFVACGRYDAYFERGLHSWDLVAGHVIASEAGAILTDFSGNTVTPAEVLCSQPGVHKELQALIASAHNAATKG